VLTDVKVAYEGFDAFDVEPRAVPDVLAERPVVVQGKWRGTASGSVTVSGVSGKGAFSQRFDVSRTPLQKLYKWADRLGQLPDAARQMVDGSPILRHVAKGLPGTGSYSEFEGGRLSYEAVVTPGQGALLADGDMAGPLNPLDPLSMPSGTSVLMRGQALEGTKFELNYKAFTIGGTTTALSGLGFGVTRGEGSIVEVYSGPVETVENNAFFGLGRQGALAVGVGSDLSMETRQMQIGVPAFGCETVLAILRDPAIDTTPFPIFAGQRSRFRLHQVLMKPVRRFRV
jgi:hypothetical protein